jgi:hypothetical protein
VFSVVNNVRHPNRLTTQSVRFPAHQSTNRWRASGQSGFNSCCMALPASRFRFLQQFVIIHPHHVELKNVRSSFIPQCQYNATIGSEQGLFKLAWAIEKARYLMNICLATPTAIRYN